MLSCFTNQSDQKIIPIILILKNEYSAWLAKQDVFVKTWLESSHFKAEAGGGSLIPNQAGELEKVICCIANPQQFWNVGSLPTLLPKGVYRFEPTFQYDDKQNHFAMAWGLGSYQFTRYKKSEKKFPQLLLAGASAEQVNNIVESTYLVRDLINTPTDDMGPSELADFTKKLAKEFDGEFHEIVGDDLLKNNFPSIFTVGRASDDAPRLLDLRWGKASDPKVTLVGKGVCFDTGGLDIKPAAGMLTMKKDMAGAAHVLGLARLIMNAKLPVRLRVLIPAVENVISGNAYKPGDIIKSRKGLTIEIGNTDAEGRVILADALAEAVTENPELLIDISTLTGAARIALGTDLSGIFSNNDEFADDVLRHAIEEADPMWRLPLFEEYRELLNSPIADINNATMDGYGGAITAALFLKEFVSKDIPWMHFDIMAWNLKSRPGRPQGGEAMAIRALFSYLSERYSKLS